MGGEAAGEAVEERAVDEALEPSTPLGKVVAHVLNPDEVRKPRGPYAKAVEKWGELEAFVESRLRQE